MACAFRFYLKALIFEYLQMLFHMNVFLYFFSEILTLHVYLMNCINIGTYCFIFCYLYFLYCCLYTHMYISIHLFFIFENERILANKWCISITKKWIQCFIRHCFNVCVLNHLIFNCHLLLLSLIWVRNSVKIFWI